jgi:DNA primase
MEIKEIKQRLSIETVLNHYDLHPDRNGMIKCPFHPEDTASLKIYDKTNTFNCFGCGANGDGIQFIELYDKRGKHEAILKAQGLTDIAPAIKPQTNQKPSEPVKMHEDRSEILTKIFESFKHGLRHPVSVKPKEYLKERNLSPDLLEIGYNSG